MTTIAQAREAIEAIAAYKTIDRAPTPEQCAAMAKWTGWGPLSPAFAKNPEGFWADISDALDSLFANDPEALTIAADTIDTSFYTSPNVIDAVFSILRETGFTGGTAFEPGCGSGRFISATPADMNIEWTGIEADPTSAGIATALNPGATIIAKQLQKAPLPTGRYDIAIGNVPFSSASIFDPAYDHAPLHEYFLLRAVDAVRDGGYVIAITSRFTMDSASGLRRLNKHADIIGAVRLPSGAFAEVGTNVATDILVLRKRPETDEMRGWHDSKENAATRIPGAWEGAPARYAPNRHTITEKINEDKWAAPVEVNNYWKTRPEHCAGTMKATGNTHNPLAVISDNHNADITAAVNALRPYIAPIAAAPTSSDSLDDVLLTDAEGRKEGSFHVIDGTIHEVRNGILSPVRATKELFALIGLRDAALQLLNLESDPDLEEEWITPAREEAHALYNKYVTAFGPLNRGVLHEGAADTETGLPSYSWRRPPMGGFRRDPDYVTVMAMEEYDQESGAAKPAPILLRRVNHRPKPATYAATPGEALSISMGEGRGIDLDRIGSLINTNNRLATLNALGNLIYRNPATGQHEIARDYLSGNVREKLNTALEAAAHDATYEPNVTALQEVLPEDLGPLEIRASLGAPWIEPRDVAEFSQEILGYRVQIKHTPAVATWEVDHKYARCTMQVGLDWGTARMNPFKLLQCALNGETPTVFDEIPNDRGVSKVRNVEETLAAEDKLKALQDRFSTWVWEDEDRAKRIAELYNVRFNSHVARRNDGSHLTFPGLAEGIQLWQWQKDIVDRIVSSERVLCGHAVGAGKTKSMITSAITLRRFGLARKPLIAVPNHLLEQIAREAQQAYPTGRFLIASREDLAGDSRRLFAARCATGDYDAVIMTHNAFTSLAVDPEREIRWIEDQKAELRGHLQDIGDDRSMGAKRIAKAIRAFEARVEALRHSTADTKQIRFDQLGVDHVSVDECFPYGTEVETESGPMPIGRIVEEGLTLKVASVNTATGLTEYKPIHRWVKKATNDKLILIRHESGEFTCTPNHPVWVEGRGYVRADSIAPGEKLRTLPVAILSDQSADQILQGVVQDTGVRSSARRDEELRGVRGSVHAQQNDPDSMLTRLQSSEEENEANHLRRMREFLHSCAKPRSATILQQDLLVSVAGEATTHPSSGSALRPVREPFYPDGGESDVLQRNMLNLGGSDPKGAQETLRGLRGDFPTQASRAEVLHQAMLCGLADESTGLCLDSSANAQSERWSPYAAESSSTSQNTDADSSEPDEGPGDSSEGLCFSSGTDLVVSEWRERDHNCPAADGCRPTESSYGVLYSDPRSGSFVRVSAEFLLCGSGLRGDEAGNRDRWEQPQDQKVEIPGSPENGGLGSTRVVSVEVLESGSFGRSGESGSQDTSCHGFVYNLEVADNHNYFANDVLVSNCHAFKRLQINTRAEGFSLGASKRATDLLLKIDVLADLHPGKPIVALFTGTPWSNTLAETFVWQRYLQPERLRLAQVDQFDAWAANFVRYETKIEVTPDGGGFRMYRRPSVIQNFPELRGMLGEVADLLPADAIDLPRPKHQATTLTVQATREQRAYVMSLSERADDLRGGIKNVRPNGVQDNMLLICGDGRKMALDPILVDLPGTSPKVEAIAENVAKIYHETKDTPYGDSPTPGALQVIFSDIGTPRPGDTQTYGRLRARLVEMGVPADRIRWIHEAKTDKAKSALFSACRDGSVSVLLGSTEKMGTGTNIQHRLRVLHHMDAPWRPSDIEQREGRGLRPGNLNPFVDIFRYVTVGSFDAFMWSALERKQRFISQIYRADSTVREIEDVSDVVLNFGQVKALAAGNPKLLEQASLNSEVRRLKMLRSVHQQGINAATKRSTTALSEAEAINGAVKLWSQAIAVLEMFKDRAPGEVPTDQTSSTKQLENFITDMLQDRNWTANYKGLKLRAVTVGDERVTHRQVQILMGFHKVGTIAIALKYLRRKPGVALASLIEELENWIADLPARTERGQSEVTRRYWEADEARNVAASAVFSGAEALAEAERQLAEVEEAIASTVAPAVSLVPSPEMAEAA